MDKTSEYYMNEWVTINKSELNDRSELGSLTGNEFQVIDTGMNTVQLVDPNGNIEWVNDRLVKSSYKTAVGPLGGYAEEGTKYRIFFIGRRFELGEGNFFAQDRGKDLVRRIDSEKGLAVYYLGENTNNWKFVTMDGVQFTLAKLQFRGNDRTFYIEHAGEDPNELKLFGKTAGLEVLKNISAAYMIKHIGYGSPLDDIERESHSRNVDYYNNVYYSVKPRQFSPDGDDDGDKLSRGLQEGLMAIDLAVSNAKGSRRFITKDGIKFEINPSKGSSFEITPIKKNKGKMFNDFIIYSKMDKFASAVNDSMSKEALVVTEDIIGTLLMSDTWTPLDAVQLDEGTHWEQVGFEAGPILYSLDTDTTVEIDPLDMDKLAKTRINATMVNGTNYEVGDRISIDNSTGPNQSPLTGTIISINDGMAQIKWDDGEGDTEEDLDALQKISKASKIANDLLKGVEEETGEHGEWASEDQIQQIVKDHLEDNPEYYSKESKWVPIDDIGNLGNDMVVCPDCDGNGEDYDGSTCTTCDGEGTLTYEEERAIYPENYREASKTAASAGEEYVATEGIDDIEWESPGAMSSGYLDEGDEIRIDEINGGFVKFTLVDSDDQYAYMNEEDFSMLISENLLRKSSSKTAEFDDDLDEISVGDTFIGFDGNKGEVVDLGDMITVHVNWADGSTTREPWDEVAEAIYKYMGNNRIGSKTAFNIGDNVIVDIDLPANTSSGFRSVPCRAVVTGVEDDSFVTVESLESISDPNYPVAVGEDLGEFDVDFISKASKTASYANGGRVLIHDTVRPKDGPEDDEWVVEKVEHPSEYGDSTGIQIRCTKGEAATFYNASAVDQDLILIRRSVSSDGAGWVPVRVEEDVTGEKLNRWSEPTGKLHTLKRGEIMVMTNSNDPNCMHLINYEKTLRMNINNSDIGKLSAKKTASDIRFPIGAEIEHPTEGWIGEIAEVNSMDAGNVEVGISGTGIGDEDENGLIWLYGSELSGLLVEGVVVASKTAYGDDIFYTVSFIFNPDGSVDAQSAKDNIERLINDLGIIDYNINISNNYIDVEVYTRGDEKALRNADKNMIPGLETIRQLGAKKTSSYDDWKLDSGMDDEVDCPDCDGAGKDMYGDTCTQCNGTGVITEEEAKALSDEEYADHMYDNLD